MKRKGRAATHGFTLIEVMAVVAIIGLVLGIMLPNLTATRGSQLERQGRDLASRIDLARERAVVTSAPHRVWLDLEEGAFRVDWFVDETRAFGEPDEPVEADPATDPPGNSVSLSPRETEERDYFPIPSTFGSEEWLDADSFFEGVITPTGWVDEGEVQLVFQTDGSTDYAEVALADRWGNGVTLEIQPLLDHVRVHRDEED